MKQEELEMLRQFLSTVFDLTHRLDDDESPQAKKELFRTIGSLAYSTQEVDRMYQERGAIND